MEDILKILLLAIIQGVTEFLPISSSGHLVIAKYFLNLREGGATLEIILHAGTLFSILFFYRNRLIEIIKNLTNKDHEEWSYFRFILIAIIPIFIIGMLYSKNIELFYNDPFFTSCLLILTGIFLISSNFFKIGILKLSKTSAFIIGLGQMLAILPGISRSGMTIGLAKLFGIESKKAAEFSFLIVIPVLCGVLIRFLILEETESFYSSDLLLLGFIISALVGYLALSWLVSILIKGHFWYFGVYCILLGSICLFILL